MIRKGTILKLHKSDGLYTVGDWSIQCVGNSGNYDSVVELIDDNGKVELESTQVILELIRSSDLYEPGSLGEKVAHTRKE